MPQKSWTKLFPTNECPPGSARFASHDDHELGVFHLSDPDRFVACHNSCPHAGGNLSAGEVDGRIVTCPWHQWRFDLIAGECTESPRVKVRTYECRVEEGYVWVRLERGSMGERRG